MELKDFKDQLTRIDSKLSELLKEKRQPKELWVTASVGVPAHAAAPRLIALSTRASRVATHSNTGTATALPS